MLIRCIIRNWRTVSNVALKSAVIQPSALHVSEKKHVFEKVATCTNFSKLRKL